MSDTMRTMDFEPKKTILLSICVPTYNRPKKFENGFVKILSQIKDGEEEVEVVIRDDSPNLETKKIAENCLVKRKIHCQYFKGEKIGLDAANLFLLEKANGQYVWWFSDDDEMQEGAIAHILYLIKKYPDINFIWANFFLPESRELATKGRNEGFFRDKNEVLELLGANIGLLSTLIIKRESGLPALELGQKYSIGFGFASLVPVFWALSGEGRPYFLKGPYIFCYPTSLEEIAAETTKNGIIENNAFLVYGVIFYKILKEFKNKFSRRSVRIMLEKNFAQVWRGILVAWVGGWDTPKGKRWRMFKLYWSFPEFWLAIPFFLLPLSVNKILFRIYKLFFSNRKFKFPPKKSS